MVEMGPETGTWGDPRVASKEKGERFLEVQVRELVKAIRNDSLWTLPDQAWRPGRGQGSTANTEQ
jgi:creatinine amidohydrolase